MRRTVVIDEGLLEEAKDALGTKGIQDTVEASLREAVRRSRVERLRKLLGTMDFDMTVEELIELRKAE